MNISESSQLVILHSLKHSMRQSRKYWLDAKDSQSLTSSTRRYYMNMNRDVYLAQRKALQEALRAFNG